jgi:hypothetical protein
VGAVKPIADDAVHVLEPTLLDCIGVLVRRYIVLERHVPE